MGILRGIAAFCRAIAIGCLLGILGVAMVAMWGVSAASNVAHAYQIAGHSEYAHVWAAASLSADVLKIGAVASIMAAYHHRLKTALILSLVVWGTMTTWSLKSSIGFSSTIMAESRALRETGGVIKKSTIDELAQLIEQQGFLRTQATVKATGANARERESVRAAQAASLAEARRLEGRVKELRALLSRQGSVAVTQAGASDPIVQFFAPTGVQQWQIEVATILFMLLMVELGGNLTAAAFGHLYFRRAPRHETESLAQPAASLREVKAVKQAISASSRTESLAQPAAIASRNVEVELIKLQRQRGGREIAPTLRAQAEAYLADIKEVFGAGTVALDKVVLELFVAWADREGLDRPLKRNQLAQQLICCGVTKVDGGGYRMPEA